MRLAAEKPLAVPEGVFFREMYAAVRAADHVFHFVCRALVTHLLAATGVADQHDNDPHSESNDGKS